MNDSCMIDSCMIDEVTAAACLHNIALYHMHDQ